MAVITFLYGSLIEAWSEFRTHRARVLMSLIGVAIAVTALTGVAAISAVAQQSIVEGLERSSGRPVSLQIQPPYDPATGQQSVDGVAFSRQLAGVMDRYGIRYWSRNEQGSVVVQTPQGAIQGNVNAVDEPYGVMHRVRLAQGSWFTKDDARRLAPAVIVDDLTWKTLGSPDLRTHPAITLLGTTSITAVIVGVTPGGYEGNLQLTMLVDSYDVVAAASAPSVNQQPPHLYSYEAWVPTRNWHELQDRISSALSALAGDGAQVQINRQDYQSYQGQDPLLILKVTVGAAAAMILLLGALGLLNISLVTVRGRIREIGIRRSFGATAGRVFFGVMMESVVATLAAGAIGVAVAILLLKNPITTNFIVAQGLQDVPPFPLTAALIGLAASAGVGALAGLLPALVAVRVKPIDAIRY
jgi:putative ABC transport system permease protein